MTYRKVMQQALDALEAHADFGIRADKAINALREALAQPAERKAGCTLCGHCAATGERITAQRQPLTDEEIVDYFHSSVHTKSLLSFADGVRCAEAAHGIKEKT